MSNRFPILDYASANPVPPYLPPFLTPPGGLIGDKQLTTESGLLFITEITSDFIYTDLTQSAESSR